MAFLDTDAVNGGRKRFGFDRKRPAAQQVYEDLHERIVSLQIAPGANLARPALAAYYGISQTPVRDAIIKLEQDGLVEIFPQSRTLVARIDLDDARETQFLRTALELEVARHLALRPDTAVVERLDEMVQRQRAAAEGSSDMATFIRIDREFHQLMCAAAGHERLWRLIIQRSGHLDRLRRLHLPTPGKMAQILADHAAIVQALMTSDVEATAAAVRKHLTGTLAAAEAIAAQNPDYF